MVSWFFGIGALALCACAAVIFIRRVFGIFNTKKFNRKLRRLSDQELLEMDQTMNFMLAYRDNVYLSLAIQSSLVRQEISRRRREQNGKFPQKMLNL